MVPNPRRSPGLSLGLWLTILGGFTVPIPSWAQCNTAPQAIDDNALHLGDPIAVDVLANDLEPDGEALTVTSVATTCNGTVSEDFGVVTMVPSSVIAEQCTISYDVADERGGSSSATVFVASSGLLFKDGFETGDVSAWDEGALR